MRSLNFIGDKESGRGQEKGSDSLGTSEQKLKLGRSLHLLRDCSNKHRSRVKKRARACGGEAYEALDKVRGIIEKCKYPSFWPGWYS